MILVILSRGTLFAVAVGAVVIALVLDRFFARCSAARAKEASDDKPRERFKTLEK
jgi:hypothetical protein